MELANSMELWAVGSIVVPVSMTRAEASVDAALIFNRPIGLIAPSPMPTVPVLVTVSIAVPVLEATTNGLAVEP